MNMGADNRYFSFFVAYRHRTLHSCSYPYSQVLVLDIYSPFHIVYKCTGRDRWPRDCSLQFADGERMHVVERVPLVPEYGQLSLYAGDSLHVSVEFVAPSQPNTYLSRWRLRTATGIPFGGVFSRSPAIHLRTFKFAYELHLRISVAHVLTQVPCTSSTKFVYTHIGRNGYREYKIHGLIT